MSLASTAAARSPMTLPAGGKLLTAAQTSRLAMLDSLGRDRVIEAYVAVLRKQEAARDAQSAGRRGKVHPSRGKPRRKRTSIAELIRHPLLRSVTLQAR